MVKENVSHHSFKELACIIVFGDGIIIAQPFISFILGKKLNPNFHPNANLRPFVLLVQKYTK